MSTSWRDRLRRGSLRGVKFGWVGDNRTTGGRRGPMHEFPDRDGGVPEDLGRSPRSFTVEAVTIGDNYDLDRNALQAALETRGPSTLVHPTMGAIQVALPTYTIDETTRKLGYAKFSMTFQEAPGTPPVIVTAQSAPAVGAAGDNAVAAIAPASGWGNPIVTGTPALETALAQDASSVLAVISSALGWVAQNEIAAFAWISSAAAVANSIVDLVATPLALAQAIVGLIRALPLVVGPISGPVRDALMGALDAADLTAATALAVESLIDLPAAASGATDPSSDTIDLIRVALSSLATVDPTYSVVLGAPVPLSLYAAPAMPTPNLQQIVDNRAALLAIVRQAALVGAARAAAVETFVDYQDAIAARDDLSARIMLEVMATSSDRVFDTLRALNATIYQSITAEAANLPVLTTYTPKATMAAALIAYKLYYDPSRGGEIVERNAIFDPAFVPGGQALTVLNA